MYGDALGGKLPGKICGSAVITCNDFAGYMEIPCQGTHADSSYPQEVHTLYVIQAGSPLFNKFEDFIHYFGCGILQGHFRAIAPQFGSLCLIVQ